MEGIIQTGGKQYIVSKGDEVLVEKIKTTEKVVEFSDILSGKKIKVEVLGEEKGDKLNILKFKPKKRYLKRKGHRQVLSRIKIL